MKNNTILLILNPKTPKKSRGGYSHISNLKSIAVIAMMLLFLGVGNAWGDSKLCQSSYTGTIGSLGSKTVNVSVGTIGTNMYRIVFESDFAMTGSDSYVFTSYDDNLKIESATMTILNGGKCIYFDMPSTSAPYFKNNVMVKTSEGNYTLSGTAYGSIDWSQTTGECSALSGNDCTGWSTEASTGGASFSKGYVYELGSDESGNVSISVKFLDDPTGASTAELYMLNESGGELGGFTAMTWSSGTKTASHTLTGQSGTIYFKVRVPYTGNVFVTKKFSVTVGTTCATGGGSGGGGEPASEGNFDCSGHTFYFANNYWHYTGYLYAHMYKSGGASTTFPGTQMTQVSGTAGIYSVTYDADYNTVIFNNGYSNTQLGAKTIEDCKYYDNGGNSHSNLTDVARHIYFVRNGYAASWSPYAHVFYDSRNNGNPGAQMVDLSLTNIDEHNLYSIIVPINNNVIFHNSSDYTYQSATQNISSSFKDYSIFNYADNKWYQTQNIYLTGSMNSWDDDNEDYKFLDWDQESTYVTLLTPLLSANTTYSFKLVTDGTWRTANASPARTYNTDGTTRKFDETGGSNNNSYLATDVAGRYYFKYDVSAGKLTITYPPYMTSASLYSKTANTAVLNVASTRGTKYKVTNSDGSVEYTVSNGGVADGSGHITVTGLTPGTQYSFKVYALDDNDTESANYSSVSAFYTLPVMGTATFNTRTYNSITLEVTGTGASQYRVVNTSPAVDQTITPSDGKVTVTGLTPYTSYSFNVKAVNAGGATSTESINVSAVKTTPQMTTATLDSKTQTTVVLSVASTGGSTYKVTSTSGTEYALSSATPADGQITVTNLTAGTAYTFLVYAKSSDATPIQSSNYIDVTTSTYPNVNAGPTGYYDCQVQAIHTSGDEYSPAGMILADWSYTAGGAAYEDGSGKKAYKVNTNTTFYAGLYFGSVWTGTPTTLCDASSCTKLHVEFWSAEDQTFDFNVIAYYGSKNNDGAARSVSTSAGTWRAMDFTLTDFGIAISDHKDVISAFKIDYGSGNTNKELIIANAYFYTDDVCESEKCHGSGRAGSGLTINGARVFDSGESYWTKAYMKNDRLHVDAKFIPASNAAAAAYVQFIKSDGGVLASWRMENKTDSFTYDFAPSDVTAEYRYDGIARYSVKFEINDDGIRQTDYQYYDFVHSRCSEEYFDIYHSDAPAGGRTSFEGGFILQPIRYFRHFPNTDWTTITLPFEVTKVTVKVGEDEYDLFPRFNNGSSDVEGYYWLKTLSGEVAISEFKDSWEELKVLSPGSSDSERAANVKPAKNTPYIIAFPDGGYYSANWVIFYGAACQTISSTFTGTSSIKLSGEDYDYNKVQFVGNNTMKESSELKNIYMLEEGEDYFSRRESATVPAFEAYVKGTSEIQKSYVALRYRGGSSTPETPTDIDALPTTECRGAIYNLSGMQMGTFADRNAMEEVLNSLRAGVYIVHIGKEVNKVIVH